MNIENNVGVVNINCPAQRLRGAAISREFGKSVDWLLTGEEKK